MAPHSRKIDARTAPPRRDRRIARHRAQWLLGGVAALGLVAGLVWGWPRLQAADQGGAQDAGLNLAIADRVIKVHQALQFYVKRPWRKPGEPLAPASAGLITFLNELEDGDGARLLANPFGTPGQSRAIAIAEADGLLTTAAERAAGHRPVAALKALGPGRRPLDGPYGPRTHGALIYDWDPASERYVLYGIGRAGGQAVVVHQVTGP